MADRSVTVRLRASIGDYQAKMTAAGRATADLAAKVEAANAKTAAGYRMIGTGAVVMGGAVVAGFGVAAKAAADFDAKMALVRTLLQAAPADMAKLRVAALSVGQAYGYSAGQVADAEAELAKAGIEVKEQLGGALVGALTLAAAGQTDVAEATEVAAAAMTEFNLHGKDVPHIADLLAAGADRALGSVVDLGYGLAQAGPVAYQFGASIEDTVGTLAAFAQAGQIGERGGTIFSQMLLKMSAPSHKAKQIMRELGISMYDASGQFVGMVGLAGQLHDKMYNLDSATRNTYLSTIFGARAIRGAAILYREGADGIQEWIDRTNVAGFAALQAGGKLDSLSGDWLKFKAAIGAASIEAGEPAQGPLRTLVQDATAATNAWRDLPGPIKGVTEALALAGGAATLAGGAALLAIPKWSAMNAVLAETSIGAVSASRALGILAKTAAVLSVIPVIDFGLDKLPTLGTHSPDVDKMAESLLTLGKDGQTTGQLLDAFGPKLKDFSKQAHEALDPSFMDSAFANIKKIPVLGWGAKVASFAGADADLTQVKKNFEALDAGLTQVSQSAGGLATAKQAWKQLADQWEATGHNADDLVELFPQFAAEIHGQAVATGDATAAAGGLTDQMDALTRSTRSAMKVAEAYNKSLHAAADPLFAMNQALQGVHTAQDSYNKAVQQHGADSKAARQASLDVASAMLEAQAAARTLAASVRDGHTSMANAKAMVEAFTKSMGLTKPEAHAILREFQGLLDKGEKLNHLRPHLSISADTTPAERAIAGLVSTLRADVSHAWNFLIGAHTTPPKHAAGGYITGPGTGTSDSIPALLSNGEYVMPAAATARNLPLLEAMRAERFAAGGLAGYAKGGPAQRYETRLRNVVADRGASPAEVRHAVLALQALSAEWEATLRRIGNAQQLRQIQHQIASASSPSERAQAEKQLAEFRRQRDQDRATRRIQAAQDLATNRQTWLFEHMSVKEQIAYLDKAMAKEKRFSDQWLEHAEQRRSLRQSEHQSLKANKAQWEFENMSAAEQVAYLDKKIAKEKKYSDQWLADMEQRKSILESMAGGAASSGPVVNNPINQPGTIPDLARYTPVQRSGGDIHVTVNMNGPTLAGSQRELAAQLTPAITAEIAKRQVNL